MLDGTATLQYVRTSGIREQWQFGSTNWIMGMADRPLAGGMLQLRAMLSAEPATLTSMGYPLLLQTAQPYRGGTLTDRQHPHELVSELALRYAHAINPDLAVEVYLAPAGEPAIGPVAYRHRPSAANDPVTPLGHHAQDITHTTFGVATVGVFSRVVKLEGSLFNGRHPDDVRTNVELGDARLDSYSGRLTLNPSPSLSISGSYAYIDAGAAPGHEGLHGSLHRLTASVLHVLPFASGSWSSAIVYGANMYGRTVEPLPSALIETNLELGRTAIFGRAEYVRRTDAELALTGSVNPELGIRGVSLGLAGTIASVGPLTLHAAARGTMNLLPAELEPFYGSRTPRSLLVHVFVRPAP